MAKLKFPSVKDIGNAAKKATNKGFNQAKAGLNKVGQQAKKGFDKVGKEAKKGFDKMAGAFNKINAFFICIGILFKSIGSYITCGFEKLLALPSCLLYYLLDFVYNVTIGLPLWFLTWLFPPLGDIVKIIYDVMMMIDDFAHSMTGFHVFKYQDSVQKRCYMCKIIPFPNFTNMSKCGVSGKSKKKIKYVKCKTPKMGEQ